MSFLIDNVKNIHFEICAAFHAQSCKVTIVDNVK